MKLPNDPISSSQPFSSIEVPYNRPLVLLSILLLGFLSGIPFLLTLSTLSYWLAEAGISNTTIGLFMLVSLPYSLKFLWAPFLDYLKVPFLSRVLGHRKSWLLIIQLGLSISLYFMSLSSPEDNIWYIAITATFVAFFSASQDILIDTYRIEMVKPQEKGPAAALETIGFRFGMLVSGAGALFFASQFNWNQAYAIMALITIFAPFVTLLIPETPLKDKPSHFPLLPLPQDQQGFRSVFKHHIELFKKPIESFSYKDQLVYLLVFIFCFKMGDTVLNAMSAPFLCDLGFSKREFATISKVFGISLMVCGGLTGGVTIQRLGIGHSAILCVVLQTLSCLMFTIQAIVGYNFSVLVITVGVESFSSGLVSAVFIAFLSEFCSQPHTASHFTMLYSLGSLSRALISACAGLLADYVGWQYLFLIASLGAFPTLYFLNKIVPLQRKLSIHKKKR